MDLNFALESCLILNFFLENGFLEKDKKEPQIFTSVESSRKSYEKSFLSSKEVTQNISNNANIVWINKTLMSYVKMRLSFLLTTMKIKIWN